ncbi:MAG: response regulator [Deltaproteobacteria bacterium]|nr:MAG: response regulator [Deltaproteobacteria bacterium]
MQKKYKILIIDDSEEILNTYNKFFTKKNYSVITASNGLDGLKILQTEPNDFDLIITDIVMPNISGVGIISIVKKKFPEILIIAITGWGEHPEMLASEAEADLVLEKPIDLMELDKRITDLIKTKKK